MNVGIARVCIVRVKSFPDRVPASQVLLAAVSRRVVATVSEEICNDRHLPTIAMQIMIGDMPGFVASTTMLMGVPDQPCNVIDCTIAS